MVMSGRTVGGGVVVSMTAAAAAVVRLGVAV